MKKYTELDLLQHKRKVTVPYYEPSILIKHWTLVNWEKVIQHPKCSVELLKQAYNSGVLSNSFLIDMCGEVEKSEILQTILDLLEETMQHMYVTFWPEIIRKLSPSDIHTFIKEEYLKAFSFPCVSFHSWSGHNFSYFLKWWKKEISDESFKPIRHIIKHWNDLVLEHILADILKEKIFSEAVFWEIYEMYPDSKKKDNKIFSELHVNSVLDTSNWSQEFKLLEALNQ